MIFTLCLSCFQNQGPACAEHQGLVLSDRSGQHDPRSIPGGSLPETGHGQLRCHPSPNICTGRLAVLCLLDCGIDAWPDLQKYLSQPMNTRTHTGLVNVICYLHAKLISAPCLSSCCSSCSCHSCCSCRNRYCRSGVGD